MDETIRVVSNDIQPVLTNTLNLVTQYGLSVIGAFVILVLGLWVAGWVSQLVRRGFRRFRYVDPTLVSFASSAVKYVIIVMTIVAVLNKFGIETASLLTVIGAAGLAIGLALQGTLSHIAAVYLSHAEAMRLFATRQAALRSQLPMLFLMVCYTMLSLWIIAQPIVA